MADKRIRTPLDDLTYQIIGCAMAVHRQQGPGLREDTYHRDLEASFNQRGIGYSHEQLYEVYDSERVGVLIGFYIPDFIVAGQVVVEVKALSGLDNTHLAQVIGYLAVTGCPVGLLLNFGRRSLDYRRILPPRTLKAHHANRQWLWVPDWIKSE